MDAAQKFFIKIALLFSVGFLIGAPALAQTLQVSRNSVDLPITGGGTSTQVLVTSSTPGTEITFSVSNPSVNWFRVTSDTLTTTATLTISLTSAPLAATSGSFTLSVASVVVQTITVNYVPGGSGNPGSTITASTNQLSPSVAINGSVVSPTVSLTTSSVSSIPFTVSVTAAANVPIFASCTIGNLSCSGNNFQVSAGAPLSMTVTSNAAGLNNNSTYVNTITITPTGGGTSTTITVTLTVGSTSSSGSYTVTPNVINFAYPSGVLSQVVSVSSNNSSVTTFNAVASSSNGWLTLTNGTTQLLNQPVSTGLSVLVNTTLAAQLTTGTLGGTITLYNPANTSDYATINVYLAVNSGTLPNLTLSQTSVTFNVNVGGSQLSLPITLQATNGGGTNYFISGVVGSWLSASASTATLPGTITLSANPSGLTAGTYNGSVSVTLNGAVTGVQSIPVTLNVGGGGTPGSTSVAPTALTFAYQSGSNAEVPQQFITVNGSGSISVSVATTGGQPWLAASGTPTAPGTVVAYVIPNALGQTPAAGTYTGTITINTGSGTSTVAVSMQITTGVVLIANPSTINVNSQPLNTSVSLTASDGSTQAFSASSSASWVTVSNAAGNTPGGINVSVNPAGLANGVNTATITVTATGAANSPVTIPVVALVSGSTGGGTVTANPSSVNFSYQLGGTAPASQTVAIASAAGSTGVSATVTTTTTSGGNWLSAGVTSGSTITTPTNLTVSATVTGLAAGTYDGTITITPVSGGTAVQVPVKLTVTAPSITATTANGTSLTYNYRVGDASPAGQSITVSGNGNFTATAQSSGGWLSVSPTSGTAPTSLTATVNTSNLAAGSYNGTITVAGTNGATGSTTITVTLVVTAPLPTVSRVTSAASFVSGSISPGEIISLFGTAIGPTAAVGLQLDSAGRVSKTIGGVQVLVNGFPSPLTFASSTQINAVVPYEVKGQLTANVWVSYLNQTSNVVTVPVAATAPGLFTANSSGTGPAAVIYPNPTLATATRGDIIVLYGTGEGETSPAGITGRVTPGTMPFTLPLLTPVVLIDGQPSEVIFYGEAPTYTSGLLQLNVRIPQNARSGDLPVVLRIGGVDSQPNVTISVR